MDADDEALRQELSGSSPDSDADTNPESIHDASEEGQTVDAEDVPQSAAQLTDDQSEETAAAESHADSALAASSDELGSESSDDSDSDEVCLV